MVKSDVIESIRCIFDLHSHILSGIDDGAKKIEHSLAMLQLAVENATSAIVATPHVMEGRWLPTWERILADCEKLTALAQQQGMDLSIFPGSEVTIHPGILNLLPGPGAYCINNGRYLLVELPASHIPNFTDHFLFTLQTRGIQPIIAHPERHPEIAQKPEILKEWIAKGMLVQINGTSICGSMGGRVMATAELLLTNNMVHVIGSDAHGIRRRDTNLAIAVTRMVALIGVQKTQEIVRRNPDKVLKNQEIRLPEIGEIQYPAKHHLIQQWVSKWWNFNILI